MTPTTEQIQEWFDELNQLVFKEELPRVRIVFCNTRRQLGQFFWGNGRGIGIKISLYYDLTEDQFRTVLLHEMCHLYCYNRGWIREHHGPRWRAIASYASRISGLDLKRVENIDGFVVAERNKAKHEALLRKKSGPWILLDFQRHDYHFLVKTTKAVIKPRAGILDKDHIAAYIVDDPLMRKFSTSRSIARGYKFENGDYEKRIRPILEKSVKIDSLQALCRGKSDSFR